MLGNYFFTKHAVAWLLLVFGLVYFGYHMIEGNHGIKALSRMQQELGVAQGYLETLIAKQMSLEQEVKLLRSDSLSPDLLEERARQVLGYAYPNEIVLLHPEQKP